MTIIEELQSYGTPEKVVALSRFFKCGKGEYGEGDLFLGVKVPETRSVVRKRWKELNHSDIQQLIESPYHEVRLAALLALKEIYLYNSKKKLFDAQRECVEFYLRNTKYINNWDLVDLSATDIVGHWLWDKERKMVYDLAKSLNMWEQRIAVVATLYFVRKGDIGDALAISDMLLGHPHDLLHKAVGWVLREVGKKDFEALKQYVDRNWYQMSRTTLRYAIEKYPEAERQAVLSRRKM